MIPSSKIKLSFLLFFICSNVYPQSITIDTSIQYQTIQGFGGFGARKVWWDTGPYWDNEYISQVIDNLGCSFIRTQIYWQSELPNDNNDPEIFNWSGFSFENNGDDNGKQMSFISAIAAKGAKLIATVWTPPIWMKGLEEFYGTYNGSPERRRPSASDLNSQCAWCGGASGCAQVGGRLKPEYYKEFAEYLAAYVKTVKTKTGVDVWAVNIQNEPMFPNPFESCVALPSEYAAILKVVGDKFKKEGLSTRLFGPEHMGEWSWGMNRNYVREILANPEINPYLDFYAVHSYVDGVAADYGSAEGWTTLHDSISGKYNKELWMTETSDFNKTGFDLAMSMAKGLYLALKFGKISGWVYWAMADAVIVNNQLTPLGYAFKNYYRYVSPGSKQVNSISTDTEILVTAFLKEHDLILVLINASGSNKTTSLNMKNGTLPSSFAVFRTSASENCVFLGHTDGVALNLPAQSITTLTSSRLSSGLTNNLTGGPQMELNQFLTQVTLRNASGMAFSITDASGRCIRKSIVRGDDELVDLSRNSNGIYILRLQGNQYSRTEKMLIVK